MIKIDFIKNATDYPANDIGISKLFIDCFKDELLFCNDTGTWYVWSGKYWQKDTKDGGLRNEKIKQFAKYCNNKLWEIPDEYNLKNMQKMFSKLYTKNYRDTVLKDAMSISPVNSDKFNSNPFLFNCQNGTYDFKTNTFKEFDKSDYITNISNVIYDKNAGCPRFNKFLDEVMESKKDKIDYLMKMAAYGFTGDVKYDCFFIIYGAKTRNGKSTFVNQIFYMLGNYANSLKPATVTRKQMNSGGSAATPDLADVKDSRFVTVSEIENGMMLDISLIKSLTGKNPVKARFLYENEQLYYPKFKLFFDTNFLMRMTDDTIFQSDRLHLIEFTRHFEFEERDLDLSDKLRTETSGIFNLIIEYYNRLNSEGFIIPQDSLNTIKRYQLNSNNILNYKSTRLFEDKQCYITTSKLYEDYKKWCEEEEIKNMAKKNFKEEMLKNGALYTEKERRKGHDGVSDNTYWVKGFNFIENKGNTDQMGLTEINDDDLPF